MTISGSQWGLRKLKVRGQKELGSSSASGHWVSDSEPRFPALQLKDDSTSPGVDYTKCIYLSI